VDFLSPDNARRYTRSPGPYQHAFCSIKIFILWMLAQCGLLEMLVEFFTSADIMMGCSSSDFSIQHVHILSRYRIEHQDILFSDDLSIKKWFTFKRLF